MVYFLLMVDKVEPTGVLKERQQADGRRQLMLTKKETKELRHMRLAEQAAALFLDIDRHRSWAETAEELGISIRQLKDLVKSKEFDEAYNTLFPEVGHDPRFRAAKGALGDMVPIAIQRLRELLNGDNVSPAVMLKTVERILELNQLDNKGVQSDRFELMEFLKNMKPVQIENVNIIPPEFARELQKISSRATADVVEGQIVSEPMHAPERPAPPEDPGTMMVYE